MELKSSQYHKTSQNHFNKNWILEKYGDGERRSKIISANI
jgi:hypothetical protein